MQACMGRLVIVAARIQKPTPHESLLLSIQAAPITDIQTTHHKLRQQRESKKVKTKRKNKNVKEFGLKVVSDFRKSPLPNTMRHGSPASSGHHGPRVWFVNRVCGSNLRDWFATRPSQKYIQNMHLEKRSKNWRTRISKVTFFWFFLKKSRDRFFDHTPFRLSLQWWSQSFLKSLLIDFFQAPKMVQNCQKISKLLTKIKRLKKNGRRHGASARKFINGKDY